MIYHFIFGLQKKFGNKPFGYFHYLAIKSCYLTQNKPTIWMHILHEPKNNAWWEKAKEYFQIKKYDVLPNIVYACNNQKVLRIQHQSDIFRLLILKEHGGVYADIDTLFYRPFFPHFENKECVLGKEEQFHRERNRLLMSGLCNALIIAKKESNFINLWLEEYKTNYSYKDWNKMSVRWPNRINIHKAQKGWLHVEPVESFHKYLWSHQFLDESIQNEPWIWNYESGDEGVFSKHLYETNTYQLLNKITPEKLKSCNSLFAKMCKNIDGLI